MDLYRTYALDAQNDIYLQKMRYIGNTPILPNLKKKGNIKG